MRSARFPIIAASIAALLVVAGCDSKPKTVAPKARETIGKTTQNVLKYDEEIAKGAVVHDPTIPVSDPLTQSSKGFIFGNVKAAEMGVKMRLDTWALGLNDGKYPTSHEEFMANIIKGPEPMALPMLPYYLEYAYDVDKHELVVLEYPDRKAEMEKKNHDANRGH